MENKRVKVYSVHGLLAGIKEGKVCLMTEGGFDGWVSFTHEECTDLIRVLTVLNAKTKPKDARFKKTTKENKNDG